MNAVVIVGAAMGACAYIGLVGIGVGFWLADRKLKKRGVKL